MKTMKVLLAMILCIGFSHTYSQDYFEGNITYTVQVELKQKDHPWNEYLSKKWGDTMVIYHKANGFHKRVHINSEPNGFNWHIYNPEKNMMYSTWHNLDTLYYYDCGETVTEFLSLKDGPSSEILGSNCESIILETHEFNSNETIISELYYNKELLLNPRVFDNYKDSYFDRIYNRTRSHLVKWSLDMDLCKVTFEAISVEEMNLPDEIFDIPSGTPIREY